MNPLALHVGSLPRLNPLAVQREDNPEAVRLRKYLTGSNLLLHLVDIETGQTRKKLVWTRDNVRLHRYGVASEKRYRVPILITYALILRPYILDLTPQNSLVRYLLEQGFDVFMLDFGLPEEGDVDLPLEVYVRDYVGGAVEQVSAESGSTDITVLGHCMGGTLAAIYASTHQPNSPRNLVLLAAPIDFTPDPPGLTGLWTLFTRQREFRLDHAIQSVLNRRGKSSF